MNVITARNEHLGRLCAITASAKEQMRGLGIDQWQKGYPAREDWEQALAAGKVTALEEDGEILAACIYQTAAEPSYASIDGAWLTAGEYVSVHRMCVAKEARGRGLAGELFRLGEELARREGMPSVRVDTHEGNLPMRRALEKAGYTCCGVIIIRGSVEDGDPRVAYEKRV